MIMWSKGKFRKVLVEKNEYGESKVELRPVTTKMVRRIDTKRTRTSLFCVCCEWSLDPNKTARDGLGKC